VLRIWDVKEVGDLIVDGQEALRLTSRLEALHDPLSPPCRLMRILCPIVQTLVLAMLEAKFHFPSRGGVGLELIGDHDARRLDGAFQELHQETTRSAGVSSLLKQNVEDEAVLIDGAPEPALLACDRNDHFVQMPFVATRRSQPADTIGKRAPNLGAHRRTVS